MDVGGPPAWLNHVHHCAGALASATGSSTTTSQPSFATGTEMARATDTPSVRERLEGLGVRVPAPGHRSPEYLGKLLQSDIQKWADRIKAAGIAGQW